MSSLGFLGVLRLMRLARILKLLRSQRDLLLLITGILSSIKSMFWLSILLGILIYTCAICFVLFIGRATVYPKEEFDNEFYFGDLTRASMTGLNLALMADWTVIIRPVLKYQPLFALGIGVYVGISCFGIMNAIIGVIVTRTAAAAKKTDAEDHLEMCQKQMAFVDNIRDIIYEIDLDGSGNISPDEIEQAANNEELLDIMAQVDLPHGFTLSDLHCMLDKDGDGELSASEFYVGMHRLIFCDEMQTRALLAHSIAQVKRKICIVRHEMQEYHEMQIARSDIINAKLDKVLSGQFSAPMNSGGPAGFQNSFGDFKQDDTMQDENTIVPSDYDHNTIATTGDIIRPGFASNPPASGPYTIAVTGASLVIQTKTAPQFGGVGSNSYGTYPSVNRIELDQNSSVDIRPIADAPSPLHPRNLGGSYPPENCGGMPGSPQQGQRQRPGSGPSMRRQVANNVAQMPPQGSRGVQPVAQIPQGQPPPLNVAHGNTPQGNVNMRQAPQGHAGMQQGMMPPGIVPGNQSINQHSQGQGFMPPANTAFIPPSSPSNMRQDHMPQGGGPRQAAQGEPNWPAHGQRGGAHPPGHQAPQSRGNDGRQNPYDRPVRETIE